MFRDEKFNGIELLAGEMETTSILSVDFQFFKL